MSLRYGTAMCTALKGLTEAQLFMDIHGLSVDDPNAMSGHQLCNWDNHNQDQPTRA